MQCAHLRNTLATINTIGIDVGKNTFHLVGLDKRGAIVLQQKVTRHQLGRRLGNLIVAAGDARRVAKIAKPTGSKLVKGPAESEKFVRWKSMKNSEENS
jgi:hypothetical protein